MSTDPDFPTWPKRATRSHWDDVVSRYPLSQFCAFARSSVLALPAYQRPVVWTGEQQRAYVAAVWRNDFLPNPIVLWSPDYGDSYAVLDGQQRLAALGVPMRRADGTVTPPTCANILLPEGEVVERAPARRLALSLFDVCDGTGSHRIGRPQSYWWTSAYAHVQDVLLTVYRLTAPPDVALEMMRAINRPGVIYDESELEANIAAALAATGANDAQHPA